jgi:carbonic anhydrase
MTINTDALAELLTGNERFVAGTPTHPNQDAAHRASLAESQTPFAVVFGCSDSRLAAEIIFDRGLGDLFVVRTAGHTVGPEVLGSIEYAVEVLGAQLIAVLGHNQCSAVRVTRDAVQRGSLPGGYLRAVVDAVAPSINVAIAKGIEDVDTIVDVHIERTTDQLVSQSNAIANAVAAQRLRVVGMSYQLDDGRVHLVA